MTLRGKRWLAVFLVLDTLLIVAVLLAFFATRRVAGDYFDSNGVRIHYTVEGAGDPVILVHGFAANADLNWRLPGVTKALAKEFRVIALDNRGHGLSDKPHDPKQYGAEMIEDVVRLMDHLGIEKAHVVGYSMGGFITLRLAIAHPERLLSAAPCAAGWREPTVENLMMVRGIVEALEGGQGFAPLLRNIERIGGRPNRFRLAIMDRLMRLMSDEKALAALMRGFVDFAVTKEQLEANTVPVLSIVGEKDPLRDGVDAMVGVMANHRAVYIGGGDHFTTIRNPLFVESLKAFLREHRAGAQGT